MKFYEKSLKVALVLCICFFLGYTNVLGESAKSGSLSLRTGTSNLPGLPIDEMGISAHVNVGAFLGTDLVSMTSPLENVGNGDGYVVGNISMSNGVGSTTVSIYAESSGWIFAYLKKGLEASRIINVNSTDIGCTILEDAIKTSVDASSSGKDFDMIKKDIQYYDFEYPEANSIMVLKDWVNDSGTKTTASYSIKMPTGITLYEISFGLFHNGSRGYSALYFNTNQILSLGDVYDASIYTFLNKDQIKTDSLYYVKTTDLDNGQTFSVCVIIYKK